MNHFDLTSLPLIKPLLRSRWPQFILTAIALGGFVLAIAAGLTGTPVGSRNFGIVFVWIGWWALLMLVAVPLFGRGWCSICPIPAPGEWLQRGAVMGPPGQGLGLGKRWPNRLRNIWLQNGAFALAALFSVVVLTQPRVTALVLAAFLFVAIGVSLIYERRAFCRYLCPVGGFIGLYSQLAPVEVRVKDGSICAAHREKTCYNGSAQGYGCPWQVFPGGLQKNTYCGTCMECLRTCTEDNIAINLRPFGSDLQQPAGRRLDEAFKAFIMLGSAIGYSAVMLGPWGKLKLAAYSVGTTGWLIYAVAFLVFVLAILPGLFWLAVKAGQRLAYARWMPPPALPRPARRSRGGRASGIAGKASAVRRISTRQSFLAFAYTLVPLGLAAWIAFSLSFVFTNISYLWPAISDPLGAGWNLFGTAALGWTPYLTRILPLLQSSVLIGGLAWAVLTTRRIAGEHLSGRRATLQALPVAAFSLFVTLGLLGLLVA